MVCYNAGYIYVWYGFKKSLATFTSFLGDCYRAVRASLKVEKYQQYSTIFVKYKYGLKS